MFQQIKHISRIFVENGKSHQQKHSQSVVEGTASCSQFWLQFNTLYRISFVPHLILFILVDYTKPQDSDTCHRIKITALRRRYQNQSGSRVIRYRVLNWGLKHHYSNTVGIRHIMWDLNKTIQHVIERSNSERQASTQSLDLVHRGG